MFDTNGLKNRINSQMRSDGVCDKGIDDANE